MGTGLHRYDITFEGGIAILEGPMACLMFAQHLKTSVFAVAQMDLNSTGSPTLKKRSFGEDAPYSPKFMVCHLGMGQIRILFGGG